MTSGTVSSSNLTSLYSNTTSFTAGVVNSSVYSVNGGLGVSVSPTTGNVVVNIGQDVSPASSVTFANVTATGNLSNGYYTLTNAIGINGQVLTTNGAGVTTWTTPSSLGLVSSVSGSGAGISVSPTTGAVIVSNTGVTSIVAGSNISISGGTGAVTINAVGILGGDVVGPASSTDNAIVRFDGTTGKLIQNSTVTIADTTGNITTNGDIAVNGGDITTTVGAGGIANLYNSNAIGTINIGNSVVTEVNIGNASGSRVQIKSPTIVGANTTQTVFNTVATTVNAFGAANALNMGSFTGITTLGNDLSMLGQTIKINTVGAAADNFIYFNNTNESLKWNEADSRFEFSNQLYISQSDPVAIFERKKTTADLEYEGKTTLQSVIRVTDAASNATDDGGSNILFSRTSGASGGPEVLYGSFQFDYYGTDNTAEAKIVWTNDNFSEPSPGNFPGTYLMQQWNEQRSQFNNNSLFVNYAAQGTTRTATSIITSNTLVFGSAHGYTTGERIIYTSTTQNGLTQNIYYYVLSTGLTATQCQLGLAPTSSAVALTNGTGLTLVFADLINRVGVNTSSPDYTLDVDGTTNSVGDLTVQADNITINDDKTNVNVNLNFGRVAPSTNAVIRWNSATNIFEWSEDGTTWHQFIDATLTAPFYNGQMLTYRINSSAVGEWINDNRVTTTNSGQRNVFEYRPLSPTAGANTSLFLRKNYSNSVEGTPGAGTYADGAGTSIGFSVASDSQAPPGGVAGESNNYANVTGVYSATVPTVSLRTSIDNGATAFSSVGEFTTAGATLPSNLAVNGGSITTTQTTGNLFNATATTVNVGNGATTEVNLGNTGSGQVQIKSPSIVGANTTQAVFNTVATTVNAFGASTATAIGSTASGTTTIGWDAVVNKDLAVNGGDITTTQATGNLFNATATTVNIGNGATSQVNIGNYASGTVNIKSQSLLQNDSGGATSTTFNLFNTITTDLNIGGAATTVDIGSTASGTTTIGYDLLVNNNVNADSYVVDSLSTYNTQTTNTSLAGTPVQISGTTRVSQKSVIKIIDNVTGEVHMLEALAFRSGTAGFLTTYAEMYSSVALATFTVTGSGGVTSILANPISSNSTTFTVARISLD